MSSPPASPREGLKHLLEQIWSLNLKKSAPIAGPNLVQGEHLQEKEQKFCTFGSNLILDQKLVLHFTAHVPTVGLNLVLSEYFISV